MPLFEMTCLPRLRLHMRHTSGQARSMRDNMGPIIRGMSACAMQKTYTVAIAPQGWIFDAPSGATLLQSAERSGLRLAASCRNGTCRTCMCHLSQGKVRYAIEWPGLSADEKRDGYILPCVAYPEADLVVDEAKAARTGI